MRDVSSMPLRAQMALPAARFVLPGPRRPDVDQAIRLACDLLADGLGTPATLEVACLSFGTALRDAAGGSGCPVTSVGVLRGGVEADVAA